MTPSVPARSWVERELKKLRFVIIARRRILWALDRYGRRHYYRDGTPVVRVEPKET